MSILFLKNNQIIFLKTIRNTIKDNWILRNMRRKESALEKDPFPDRVKESVSPADDSLGQLVFRQKWDIFSPGKERKRIYRIHSGSSLSQTPAPLAETGCLSRHPEVHEPWNGQEKSVHFTVFIFLRSEFSENYLISKQSKSAALLWQSASTQAMPAKVPVNCPWVT